MQRLLYMDTSDSLRGEVLSLQVHEAEGWKKGLLSSEFNLKTSSFSTLLFPIPLLMCAHFVNSLPRRF